jgi:hypothetical protein
MLFFKDVLLFCIARYLVILLGYGGVDCGVLCNRFLYFGIKTGAGGKKVVF